MSGQYVAYQFFRVDPAWRRLPVEERVAGKDAFAEVIEDWAGRMTTLRAYTVTGVRPDSDFFLWKITERYEDLGELGAALNGTPLAGWLETPYSYLATTKASQYTQARKPRKIVPRGQPYLVVYPFVKVRPWYALSEEQRQEAMDEHIRIGREEFPTIVPVPRRSLTWGCSHVLHRADIRRKSRWRLRTEGLWLIHGSGLTTAGFYISQPPYMSLADDAKDEQIGDALESARGIAG